MDIHVHSPGEIECRAGDPGTIEWDVARAGIVLYAQPGAPRLSVPSDRVSEPSGNPPASAADWRSAANEDVESARLLLEAGKWRNVCFHVQQACEKQLKALLVSCGVRPPRSHRLDLLLAKLRDAGRDLPGLHEDWSKLSTYAIAGRHPGRQIDEAESRAALAAAERVVAAVAAAMDHPSA